MQNIFEIFNKHVFDLKEKKKANSVLFAAVGDYRALGRGADGSRFNARCGQNRELVLVEGEVVGHLQSP